MTSLSQNEDYLHKTPFANKSLSKVQINGYTMMKYFVSLSQYELLEIYCKDSLNICLGTFDYWCVSHLAAIYCNINIQYNVYLIYRALIILLESENSAAVELVQMMSQTVTSDIWQILEMIKVSVAQHRHCLQHHHFNV